MAAVSHWDDLAWMAARDRRKARSGRRIAWGYWAAGIMWVVFANVSLVTGSKLSAIVMGLAALAAVYLGWGSWERAGIYARAARRLEEQIRAREAEGDGDG